MWGQVEFAVWNLGPGVWRVDIPVGTNAGSTSLGSVSVGMDVAAKEKMIKGETLVFFSALGYKKAEEGTQGGRRVGKERWPWAEGGSAGPAWSPDRFPGKESLCVTVIC